MSKLVMSWRKATAFLSSNDEIGSSKNRSEGFGLIIYIDGAHAIHRDMKGHAGVMVTEGGGAIYASATKNELNTTSSTETEIVCVGEKLPKHIWYRNFRMEQGDTNNPDILFHDNESAILMEKNGRLSVGKGSKHIDIRYFFITDRVEKNQIKVEHCPTEEMIADFFTKPLQGTLFRKFRDLILGVNVKDFERYRLEYINDLKEFGLADNIT